MPIKERSLEEKVNNLITKISILEKRVENLEK